MKRRVTFRPSKAQSVFGLIWSTVFVLIGICVAIPIFGAFGILWTVMAGMITAYQGYLLFAKGNVGPEINILEDEEQFGADRQVSHPHQDDIGPSAQARMEQLQSLKQAGLITAQEFEQKRQEILKDL